MCPIFGPLPRIQRERSITPAAHPRGHHQDLCALEKRQAQVFAELPGLEVHALAIDAQDRVYAAFFRTRKSTASRPSGKPQLFFDAKSKYIWSWPSIAPAIFSSPPAIAGIIYKVTQRR